MRSLLFVPGDSERKVARALKSSADAVILDLEDSVSTSAKPAARALCAEILQSGCEMPLIVRVNGFDTGEGLRDLAAVVRYKPSAVMLPKCESSAALWRLDRHLAALEERDGLEIGSVGTLAIVTETARSLGELASYASVPERTRGLTWGGEDLSSDIGALENRDSSRRYLPLYEFARSFCLLAATSARVAPIDAVYTDFRDRDGLVLEARAAAASGFAGKLAIHPDQIEIINDAFTPSVSQIEWAHQVVGAFQSAPGTGVASVDGEMLDRPHLLQARRLLSREAISNQGSGAQ